MYYSIYGNDIGSQTSVVNGNNNLFLPSVHDAMFTRQISKLLEKVNNTKMGQDRPKNLSFYSWISNVFSAELSGWQVCYANCVLLRYFGHFTFEKNFSADNKNANKKLWLSLPDWRFYLTVAIKRKVV